MCNNITAVACMIYSLHVNVHKYYRRVRGFYITVWYVPMSDMAATQMGLASKQKLCTRLYASILHES